MKREKLDFKNYVSLRDALKETVKTRHPKTVAELAQLMKAGAAVDEDIFVYELKALVREGTIELGGPSYQLRSLADYLFTITLSGWFWATVALAVVGVLSVLFVPDIFPISVIRWLFGSVFVLFLPGNTLIHVLFPKKENLDRLEHFLLSVGLSLAVVPLVGLVLNYLPWGISFVPVTVSLTIFVVIFALLGVARKYGILRARTG
jgi:hypothetical protein